IAFTNVYDLLLVIVEIVYTGLFRKCINVVVIQVGMKVLEGIGY
ncbi:unnamed protein product, partial [marine sediment metagenome]